jgi:hypothetical protein
LGHHLLLLGLLLCLQLILLEQGSFMRTHLLPYPMAPEGVVLNLTLQVKDLFGIALLNLCTLSFSRGTFGCLLLLLVQTSCIGTGNTLMLLSKFGLASLETFTLLLDSG